MPITQNVAETSNFLPLGAVLLFGLVALVMFVVWVWALIDALNKTDGEWAAAGQSKLLWILLIALLGALGAILYVAMARPALRRPLGNAVAQCRAD